MPYLTRQGGALLISIVCAVLAPSHPADAQTSSMPSGWASSDIGNPMVPGSVEVSGDTMTVRGAGADIGGTSDQFHFAYQALSGDVDIRIRIEDLQDVNPGAKAGLMIRGGLTANAKHAFMLVSSEQGLAFQWRSQVGKKAAQVSGAAVAAPAWVRLVRKGNLFSAYSSPTGAVWTLVGSATVSIPKNALVGLAVTSHDPNQTATGSFASPAFGSSGSSSVPAPWAAGDVGSPALAGSASDSGGTFTLTGAGVDIWDTSDEFQFVYQPVTGDTQIVARAGSLQGPDEWSKAGVMIREGLTGPAAQATVFTTRSNGWQFTRRPSAGTFSYSTPGSAGTAPGWVRLVREGNLFSAYQSQDGSQWTLIDTETIPMPATVYVGLAITSHNATAMATATFSNVAISTPTSSNAPPTVSMSGPAAGASYTAPATIALSATAGDVDGAVSRVDFYAGTRLVGSDVTSPFSATWSNVSAGTYTLTAVATDNEAAAATSQPVSVTVAATANKPPTVSISGPAASASYTAPASIAITATAGDTDGSVTRVDFYANGQLRGSDTTSPFSITWSSVAAGTYNLTAVATDNAGATTTSQPVSVTVAAGTNKPPTVSISGPVAGASYTAPASIAITATAGDTDGSVTRVDFYANGQLRGSDTTSPFSIAWSSVAAGTYNLSAVATDNAGATTTSQPITVTVAAAPTQPPSVPAPWAAGDIGSPALPGSASASGGTFAVTGAGVDIWDTSDQFQFVYQPITGDTQIVARVASLQGPDEWSKAGVMIREALSGPAAHATLFTSRSNGWQFTRRPSAGTFSYSTPGSTGTAPGWVRLVREGNLFSAYQSQDGSQWTLINTETIPMPATVYVGLAITSHTTTATATATFSNVAISAPTSSNTPPTVSVSGPAAGATYTAPASIAITATAGDTDGSVTRVDFYANGQLRGSDTTSPFSITWSSVAAGTYNLTAVATDNAGATTTSAPITVTVVSITTVPTTLVFVAPVDYATNVTSCTIELRRSVDAVTASPVATRNLGKPAVVGGEISVLISTLVDPLPAGSYYGVVVATGPGGSTPSSKSAVFSK